MSEPSEKWYFIVNPNAGSRKGVRDWPKISKMIRESGIPHETALTDRHGHAIELTLQGLKQGYRKIAVVGGDGTLNEVVNGIFSQKAVSPTDLVLSLIHI